MISVCILTKNAEDTLKKTLDSCIRFDEVIILDNGSTDRTFQIAKSYPNVKWIESKFIGFGPLRNKAAKEAKSDWILMIDSDEILSDELLQEIQNISLEKDKAYSFLRINFYNGKKIKGCGWGNDRVVRLYHKNTYQYNEAKVHEALQSNTIFSLKAPIYHTPYRSIDAFLNKMQHYSTLFAEQNKGKKSSFSKAFFHATFSFLKSYLLKGGIFSGKEGLLISIYNANTTFYKYLKLIEINRKKNIKESFDN